MLSAVPVAAEPPGPYSPADRRLHVVAAGDTLGAIARRYRVSVTALVSANRLPGQDAKLRVGQRLTIPRVDAVVPAPPRSAAPPSRSAVDPSRSAAASSRSAVAAPSRNVAAPSRSAAGPRAPVSAPAPAGLALAVPDFVEGSLPFAWPVEGAITSLFGRRRSGWHRGIDIKAERGTVVFAAAAGLVVVSGVEPRYGRVVKIEHVDGFMTVYAHNDENLVEVGTRVAAGDPIATLGRTGRASTHHLHFEIRRNGAVYNPLYLLPRPPSVGRVELAEETEEDHE